MYYNQLGHVSEHWLQWETIEQCKQADGQMTAAKRPAENKRGGGGMKFTQKLPSPFSSEFLPVDNIR